MTNETLRKLPSVNKLIHSKTAKDLQKTFGLPLLKQITRIILEEERNQILKNNLDQSPSYIDLINKIENRLNHETEISLNPIINATGVILHTNLGRAPLSTEAQNLIADISGSYNTIEFDVDSGQRGQRGKDAERLICQVTGSEDALVVNNNAAAIILILKALAFQKSIAISRGQLIEIGGGFRIPDVIRESGVQMIEIGTTNRTHIDDYLNAIKTDDIALILRAHHSNYNIIGFTTEPTIKQLVSIGHQYNIPIVDDIGSGTLIDTSDFGLTHEPMIQESLSAGANLVCFSADKLLGGPQAGIIIGNTNYISILRKHPLARAIRADKLCLAGLSATLLHYIKNEAIEKIPVWQMISMNVETIQRRAKILADQIGGKVVAGLSTIGGGSLPGETLPTFLVSIAVNSPSQFTQILRQHKIITRIKDDQIIIDLRTVQPNDDKTIATTINKISG